MNTTWNQQKYSLVLPKNSIYITCAATWSPDTTNQYRNTVGDLTCYKIKPIQAICHHQSLIFTLPILFLLVGLQHHPSPIQESVRSLTCSASVHD